MTIVIVHGNWSSWSSWPNCNKPCNGGSKIRKRLCNNPEPANGGRDCEGSATESQSCNPNPCPADNINCKIRFPTKEWKETMANHSSKSYVECANETEGMLREFYHSKGENVMDVKVLNLSEGSIIASINVSFLAIDALQLISLQEELAGGTLGTTPAELLNLSSSYVPGEPPVILEAISNTSTSIELRWTEVTELYSMPLLGYIIVYKKRSGNFRVESMKSVLPMPLEAVVEDLEKFTDYIIRIYAFTSNGNGIPSQAVAVRTQEDVPSQTPPNIIVQSTSSTTIDVSWQPIDQAYVHGILLGYEVRFAKDDGLPLLWESRHVHPNVRKIILSGLWYYSKYKIVVCAKTSKGCGKEYHAISYTWDDVPTRPPQNVLAQNLTSEKSINVNWSPVLGGHVNGPLLGYSLKYQRIRTAERVLEDIEEDTLTFKPDELSTVLQVKTYSTYRIRVAAFTPKGLGPYSEYVLAETCRCPKILFTNFWATSPYLTFNKKDNKLEGIFSGIITEMVHTACGICPAHGDTIIEISTNGKNGLSTKEDVLEVLKDIDDVPEISFPIYGNKYITTYLGDYAYINIVESPGVAFLVASRPPGGAAMNMIRAVLQTVPLIVLSACMAFMAGFIVWFLDSKFNPEEFPLSFLKGVGEGFWWSYISMTTVGYGDRAPKSIIGRIFGIMWTLTGLVIISILIGAIASSLTSVTVERDVILYGTEIGALRGSAEYRLGVLHNAKVNTKRQYSNMDDIRMALEDGEIQGALIDTYVIAEHKESLLSDRIFVKKILDRPFGYGVVLSGAARNVELRCRDYINMKITDIFQIIQNTTKTLDARSPDAEVDESTGLFDGSSQMFLMSVASLAGTLIVTVAVGIWYHICIYVPSKNKEEKLKESGSHFSYKESLIKEMKELVYSFYRDVQIKICFIKKTQKREIRDMIKELKLMTLGEKSSKQRKKDLEESVCGNDTASTWTKEKQSDLLREIVQLSSSMKYVQEQSHQLKVPNSMGLGACNSRCSSSLGSTQHLLIS
ncbi:unnamed protein product, partial [Porites evermanni]